MANEPGRAETETVVSMTPTFEAFSCPDNIEAKRDGETSGERFARVLAWYKDRSLTVGQLIEALQQYPSDMMVEFRTTYHSFDHDWVGRVGLRTLDDD